MKTPIKILLILLCAAMLGGAVVLAPDGWVASIGGALAPRGEISGVFIPVFRRVLAVSSSALLLVFLGAALFSRYWWGVLCATGRELGREMNRAARAARDEFRTLSAWECATVAILALGALGIRLWYLNQPIGHDEATTVHLYAGAPWYIGLANYSDVNNHLLNTLLVRFCIWAGGNREWVIRLPALLAGLLCVGIGYAYARLMYSRNAAILSMALLSMGPAFVDMSTNARGYSMVALGGILAHICACLIVQRGSRLASIGYALSLGLGLVAVPVALLFVASSVLWTGLYSCALYRRDELQWEHIRRFIIALLAGGALALAGYAPMLLVLGPRWLSANEWVVPMQWSDFFFQFPHHLHVYATYSLKYLPTSLAAVLILSGLYYLFRWIKIERTKMPTPLIAGLSCLALLMLNRRYPYWGVGPMWMFLTAFLLSAFAAGFSHFAARLVGARYSRWLMMALAIATTAASGVKMIQTNPRQTMRPNGTYELPDSHGIARYLAEQVGAQDKILFNRPAVVFQYYGDRYSLASTTWDWNLSEAKRVFVIQANKPLESYEEPMWALLRKYGIESTKDMDRIARFDSADIWLAHLGNKNP